jgi:D-sedoheptulose 7-phosphate isomerase
MKKVIVEAIQQSIKVKGDLLSDPTIVGEIEIVVKEIISCYRNGGKVLLCGNGGSAADAQHIAAELSGRFYFNRPPLYAEALHANTSYLTAVANDYSFDEVYARLITGMGRKGDVLIAISTSGNSPNILKAVEAARTQEMVIVGFTGSGGGKLKNSSDFLLNVNSSDTPRIQEAHIMIGHIICQLVESELFPLE